MFQIGASLREARTRRGYSAADVQKAIRIRERYLMALEEERWELLPGEAYTKGFLRTYAEFLGLDGNLYVDEYNSRFVRDEEPFVPESLSVVRGPQMGLLRPLLAIAAIVAAVAAVAAWRLGSAGNSSPPQTATPGTNAAGPAAVTTPPAKRSKSAGSTKRASHAKTAASATTTGPAAPAKPSFAVISATRGRCWLQIRTNGAHGAIVYEGVLDQGQTQRVSLARPVWIRVGAPWNLDVRLGGRVLGGLPSATGNVMLTRSGLSPAP